MRNVSCSTGEKKNNIKKFRITAAEVVAENIVRREFEREREKEKHKEGAAKR